ncbi:type IV toxin-antitoxin system AbiEi family antitoxin domain-containing protein [Sporichthya sp.]|uniref:type IV toxin-antitoxin system AbiEi family antitoxin domain-containing protein n=1 Tax=Sporichthya sp. TaxID=65475 RepID=UPI00182D1B64|nr:type IV toxin-antitoxin system AbiEi family antitoxin domain-containing protein [Sporichthya sp.]MBA3741983.1 type IV toxin-antitoxin system AbiEi family antitoxin domain-containing protein [Sporichthya sp.]
MDARARLESLEPIFRSRDAVAAGISWRDLYAMRDAGEILQLSRGLYQRADSAGTGDLDFVTVCRRAPHGTICLDSALAYWDLTDDIPAQVHLAVAKGNHRPRIDYPPTRVHIFQAEMFELGRVQIRAEAGAEFAITDRERTLADAFRSRRLVSEEAALHALRRYLSARPDRARLAEVARSLRAWPALREVMRVMEA